LVGYRIGVLYMCGIVGYVGRQNASGILIEGLKRLEYRGYDSAGVALINGQGLEVMKKTGRVENVAALVNRRNRETKQQKKIA